MMLVFGRIVAAQFTLPEISISKSPVRKHIASSDDTLLLVVPPHEGISKTGYHLANLTLTAYRIPAPACTRWSASIYEYPTIPAAVLPKFSSPPSVQTRQVLDNLQDTR